MTNSRRIGVVAAVCAIFLACASTAAADIGGFNAAMRKGDIQTAAAEAASTWATWDRSDEQTALLAREFGFVSLVAGKYEMAETLGRFLVEDGATLKTPDDQPLTSAVLYRAAQFRLKADEAQREALRTALVERAAGPGIDMTSVVGWEVLYNADFSSGRLESAIDNGTRATDFMKRDEKDLLARRRAAEVSAAAARFLAARNNQTTSRADSYNALADLHDTLSADIDNAEAAGVRDPLWALKWRTNAWVNAAEGYIYSTYEQVSSLINTSPDRRNLVEPKLAQVPEDKGGLPMCKVSVDGRKLRYPASKSYRGAVGSVIVRLQTGIEGKVVKTEVLAAVPLDVFAESVVDTVSTWRLKPANGVERATCRLNTSNMVLPITFVIG